MDLLCHDQDASATRETYLRAEVAPLEDRDDEDSETVAAAEAATQKLFLDIVDTQVPIAPDRARGLLDHRVAMIARRPA